MYLVNDENKKVRISMPNDGILFEIEPNSEIEVPDFILPKIMTYVHAFRLKMSETSELGSKEPVEKEEPKVEEKPKQEEEKSVETAPSPPKRKRGRPRKVRTDDTR